MKDSWLSFFLSFLIKSKLHLALRIPDRGVDVGQRLYLKAKDCTNFGFDFVMVLIFNLELRFDLGDVGCTSLAI